MGGVHATGRLWNLDSCLNPSTPPPSPPTHTHTHIHTTALQAEVLKYDPLANVAVIADFYPEVFPTSFGNVTLLASDVANG